MSTAPAERWLLEELLRAAGIGPPPRWDGCGANQHVTGLHFDSRQVRPGSIYLALPGRATHGARFTPQALAGGAIAVLTDAEGARLVDEAGSQAAKVPVMVVDDPRRAMAHLAVTFHHDPASRVPMFAITGTNGKTTTTILLESALSALGLRVGTLGTLGLRWQGRRLPATTSTITTPESPDLQQVFADLLALGAQTIAMEVSSHALALGRVTGTHFAVAGFTMLGRDHLDFHADMEDYFAAKASLFTREACSHAVVNTDGEWGRRLAALVTDVPLTTVGRAEGSMVRIVDDEPTDDGLGRRASLDVLGTPVSFVLPLPGDHNVDNAALALAMVQAAGLDVQRAASGLARATVPGRMQRVELGAEAPTVVVDFAHTPQAVEEALDAVRMPGRLITVLGAGGDRDREKRPLMGRAAGQASALVVVTDDNPRSEDPALIRAAVRAGVEQTQAECVEVGGRREAIAHALAQAQPGDAVMVLGKGHETDQQLKDQVLHFDDVRVVAEEWAAQLARKERRAGASSQPHDLGGVCSDEG